MEYFWIVLYSTLGYLAAGVLVITAIFLTLFIIAACIGIVKLRKP